MFFAMPATPPPEPPAIVQHVPVEAACVVTASEYYGVPLVYVIGVMATEGGRVGECVKNTNGTRDCGPMQVNTVWQKKLAPYGITEPVLRDNGCLNVAVGTWILAQHLSKHPPWKAIGAYHSLTPRLNSAYQHRVYRRLQNIKDVQHVINRANGLIRSK